MSKEDKTPAFPNVPDGAGSQWANWDMGMTLRQYYAAKAMQGMCTNRLYTEEMIVKHSFSIADAMIAFERNEK